MQKLISRFLLLCVAASLCAPFWAYGAQYKAVESITILADANLSVPVAQLASAFARENLISVSVVFGQASDQKKKIETAEAGDVLITPDKELINQLKIKGLVDVYSVHEVMELQRMRYQGVVIAGESMTSARKFLKFTQSDEAKEIIKQSMLP